MGFLEDRRRRAHASSMNWDITAAVMLMGYELGLAEEEGMEDMDERGARALEVRDAVLAEIGHDRFIQSLIEVDYEMATPDQDEVIERAVQVSGYQEVRDRLFPT